MKVGDKVRIVKMRGFKDLQGTDATVIFVHSDGDFLVYDPGIKSPWDTDHYGGDWAIKPEMRGHVVWVCKSTGDEAIMSPMLAERNSR
jgi:hypothetical protein